MGFVVERRKKFHHNLRVEGVICCSKILVTTYKTGSGVAQSDYGLDDWGLIPDRGRGFFF
jgi:hypothetical protein